MALGAVVEIAFCCGDNKALVFPNTPHGAPLASRKCSFNVAADV